MVQQKILDMLHVRLFSFYSAYCDNSDKLSLPSVAEDNLKESLCSLSRSPIEDCRQAVYAGRQSECMQHNSIPVTQGLD